MKKVFLILAALLFVLSLGEVIPVVAQTTQTVSFTHAAGTYRPGQAWSAVVSTSPVLANQPVTLCYTEAPAATGAAGTCSSAESLGLPAATHAIYGTWIGSGTFSASDPNIIGTWKMYAEVGGFKSSIIQIDITPTYTAGSVTLTMTMPGGVAPPFGSQAEDTWILSAVTNPIMANQPVSVCIAKAPWVLQIQGTCTPAGNTDSAGKWTTTGTFPIDPNQAGGIADIDGRWSEYVKVGNLSSNTVDYSFVYSQLPRAVLTGDWGEKTIGNKSPGSSWWLNLATTPPMRGVVVYECYTKAPPAKGIEKDRCDTVESYGLPARTDSNGVWNGAGTFQDDPTAVGEWIVYMKVGDRNSNRVMYNFLSTGGSQPPPGGVCTPACTAGYQCVSGSCVPTTTTCTPACATGQTCVGGQCIIPGATCTPACTTGQTCTNGQCTTSGGGGTPGTPGGLIAESNAIMEQVRSLIASYKAMLTSDLNQIAPAVSSTPSPDSNLGLPQQGMGKAFYPASATVNATLLNVRSAPSTSASVVTQLTKGSTFTVINEVQGENIEGTDWWLVTSDNNYVWSGGIALNFNETSVTVNATLLNIRSAPNTTASVIGQLTRGSVFTAASSVKGESIEGIDDWWVTKDGNYVWAGGTTTQ